MSRITPVCMIILTVCAVILVLRDVPLVGKAEAAPKKITCETWTFEWDQGHDNGLEKLSTHAEAMQQRLTRLLSTTNARVVYDRVFPMLSYADSDPKGHVGVMCVAL